MSTLMRRQAIPPGGPALRLPGDILCEESLRVIPHSTAGTGRQRLLLDLRDIRIPTAAGLGALIALHKRLRRRGGALTLLNVRPWAYEVFSLTGLTELLDVRAA